MKPLIAMRAALAERDLFGEILVGESWAAWRILLIAICGEPLRNDERGVFRELTGREREPLTLVDEAWMICGRRSGKTRAAAVLASYIAALCDHTEALAPGERGTLANHRGVDLAGRSGVRIPGRHLFRGPRVEGACRGADRRHPFVVDRGRH